MPSGQNITQSGSVTPNHAVMWTLDGVAQDAGPATAGNLTGIGITNNGGVALAVNSGKVSSPYTQFAVVVQGNTAQIVVGNFGTTAPAELIFVVNGETYSLGNTGGNVVGPSSSTNGHAAVFNGSTGEIIADAGGPPLLATSAAFAAFLATLPTTLPGTSGQPWINGGVLCVS